MYHYVSILLLAGLFAVPACEKKPGDRPPGKTTSEDVRRVTDRAVETAAENVRQIKEEYQKKLDARLKELDAEITTLRAKGRELKEEAKANWEQKMDDLKAKHDAVRAKLAEIDSASEEDWEDVQQEAQSAWDELEKAFRDATRELEVLSR
ncbi:MAG TPA: hypothetical protein VJL29_00750 [Thermoguttaceae bacterium]|nr:hypothetical protein [Thermoguttaceae bacterium]